MYKKVLVYIIFILSIINIGGSIQYLRLKKKSNLLLKKAEKNELNFKTLINYVNFIQNGKSINEFFIVNEYNKIAIYGMGQLGNRIIEDIRNGGLIVQYVVDIKGGLLDIDIPVFRADDKLPPIDVVVVTVPQQYKEIKDLLSNSNCDIVSIDEIITELR